MNGLPSESVPINIGIIGCGAIAREHLAAISEIPELRVVGFCDVDLLRAENMARLYAGAFATNSPQQLIEHQSVSAVYICTHHNTHAPIALACCAAGRNVMMEKPLALTVQECRQIAHEVERTGVMFMTAFKLRYAPSVARARKFLSRPIIAIAQIMDERWPDDFWAMDPLLGGGSVVSQGVHILDLLCYMVGSEPLRVFAEGGARTHPGGLLADTIAASIVFENGCVATFAQSDAGTTPYVSKFSLQIADGERTIHIHNRLKSLVMHDSSGTRCIEDERELGMLLENREFAQAIIERRQPASNVRDGVRATVIVQAMIESARSGSPVMIDHELYNTFHS